MCDKYTNEEVERLEAKMKEQERRIDELEKRLLAYENAHTPPSKQRFPSRNSSEKSGKSGRPNGHEGSTRQSPVPDKTVHLVAKRCPFCKSKNLKETKVEKRVITDIPKPVKLTTTEFLIHHYSCSDCDGEFCTKHKDLPNEGAFGNNTIAYATLMKYEDRIPYRKIKAALKRQFGIEISPSSILEFANRASKKARKEYETILGRIKEADVVYADETSIRVNGKKYWIWIFNSGKDTLSVIRHSRGRCVLEEILGKEFRGIVVCNGWKPYKMFDGRLQRCWAHLLREADYLSNNIEEAKILSNDIHMLYENVSSALATEPPPEKRALLRKESENNLIEIICKSYDHPDIRKFTNKINNGIYSWFTFVEYLGVEPTNNRAERALREHVVQRKIIGTLRNEKGTFMHETMMSVLATWRDHGYNTYDGLMDVLRS